MVPITAVCAGIAPEDIQVTPQNLSLHVEDKDTQEFVVNVTTNNTRPTEDTRWEPVVQSGEDQDYRTDLTYQ